MELNLKIALPISANQRLIRAGKQRRMITSKRYRNWFNLAVLQIKQQRNVPMLTGRVAVEAYIHYPDKRRRDLDNSLKGLFDACTHACVWADDSQIDSITVIRDSIERPGYVFVKIKEI